MKEAFLFKMVLVLAIATMVLMNHIILFSRVKVKHKKFKIYKKTKPNGIVVYWAKHLSYRLFWVIPIWAVFMREEVLLGLEETIYRVVEADSIGKLKELLEAQYNEYIDQHQYGFKFIRSIHRNSERVL